ncbi:hypothetical protein YC2023_053644 [Brassica napus]
MGMSIFIVQIKREVSNIIVRVVVANLEWKVSLFRSLRKLESLKSNSDRPLRRRMKLCEAKTLGRASTPVIGQHEAVKAINREIRRACAGLKNPNRPITSFIFNLSFTFTKGSNHQYKEV